MSEKTTCVITWISPVRWTMFVVPGSVMSPSMGTNKLLIGPGCFAHAGMPRRLTSRSGTRRRIFVFISGCFFLFRFVICLPLG